MRSKIKKPTATGQSKAPPSVISSTPPPLDELQRYEIDEAVAYLRVSRNHVYNLIRAGTLATITDGRRRFVPGSEIARLSRVGA